MPSPGWQVLRFVVIREYLFACESVHLSLDYVLTTELDYSRRNPSLKPRETREDDDRLYVAAKLVNIAQCLDRSLAKADGH